MSERGTYALLLRLDAPRMVVVGALGALAFPQGWYLYLGSARGPGGLEARLARHRRQGDKRFHWHIDYLRAVATLAQVWTHTGHARRECEWAAAAAALPGANVVAPRFGASDCRCPAHLFHYSQQPQADELGALLQLALNKHNLAKVTKPSQGWLRPTLDEQELNALINTLTTDTASDERRERAALALGALGDAALPPLRDLLRAPDAEQRWWAIRALAALGSPPAVSLLIQALSDPDPDARVCAALGLGELKATEAIEPLTDLLADASAYVGCIAGNALVQIGPPAIPALIQTLNSPSPAARAGAARVLVPLESHDAIPALFAALDDDSALVTHYAEQALERMGVGMVYFMP